MRNRKRRMKRRKWSNTTFPTKEGLSGGGEISEHKKKEKD